MKKFVAPGDSVQVTAPYAVVPGDGMLIGSLFCVSTKKAALGESTDAVTEGQIDLAAVSSETAAEGTVAYWDAVNKRVSVAGGVAIGTLPNGKLAGVAEARVRLGAPSLVSGYGKKQALALEWPWINMTAGGAFGHTYHEVDVVPFDYDAVQLAILHTGTSAHLGMQAAVCSTESLVSQTDPIIHGVSISTLANPGFQRLLWAGQTNSPAIAAPGAAVIAAGAWSDVANVASVKRTDGGPGRLFMTRLYNALGGSVSSFALTGTASYYTGWTEALALAQNAEFAFKASYRKLSVDGISNPAAFVTPTRENGQLAYIKRFFLKGAPIPSILFSGDSRFQGTAGATDLNMPEFTNLAGKVKTQLARRGINVATAMAGMAARKTYDYAPWVQQLLALQLPSVLVYLVHSVNDQGDATRYPTAGGDIFFPQIVTDQIALATQIKALCDSLGVAFVPVTCYPVSSALTAGQLTQRQRVIDWVASLGVPYVDPSQLLGQANGTWRADIPNDGGNHVGSFGRDIQACDVARCVSQYF